MSNEIKYSSNIVLANGTLNDNYNTSSLTANQTTPGLVRNVQTVAATWVGEPLSLGNCTTPRLAHFANLETPVGGNYVEVGVSVSGNFHAFLKLEAGKQSGPLWLSNLPPYARANTGPVKLFYLMYQE